MSEETAINNEDIIANDVPTTEPDKPKPVRRKITMKPKGRKIIRRGSRKAAPIKTTPPAYERDALTLSSSDSSKATQPWRPASMLTALKLPGMRPRWVRKDMLEKRIEEGWQPRLSDSKSRVEAPEKTIIDGVPLGRYVVKRNMVLCDMPEEMAKGREDYFRQINDAGLKSQKNQFANETVVSGESRSYGDIKIERE